MKIVERSPKFIKPTWLAGKTVTCIPCNRDYIFEQSDIDDMMPSINGKKCGQFELNEDGRRVDFPCCGCGQRMILRYYDYYSHNW